jgi:hypothetical protein
MTSGSGGAASNPAAKKPKAKKGKDTLVPNGAQIVDPASSSAPVKQTKKDKPDVGAPTSVKKGGANNTLEHRLDYVVSTPSITNFVVQLHGLQKR